MSQNAFKAALIIAVLGFVVQDANAIGRWGGCGWGRNGCYGGGYGGYTYGGWSGFPYASFYSGWGYPACGYGESVGVPSNGKVSPDAPTNSGSSNGSQAPDSVALTVSVPADARVFINNHPTTSTGDHRQYISTGVQPGAVYRCQVRAEYIRNGKTLSEEKLVSLIAGRSTSLVFNGTASARTVDVAASAQR
jgi:uncharacterized protein (TIGR03000 family)